MKCAPFSRARRAVIGRINQISTTDEAIVVADLALLVLAAGVCIGLDLSRHLH